MDNNENPLDKISRQLSELGPVPNMAMSNDGLTPPIDNQWTQFGGGGVSGATQMPFHNLYTWNSLDLSDGKSMSQPGARQPQDYSPSEMAGQPAFGTFNQSRNCWSGSNHHFSSHQLSSQDVLSRGSRQDQVDPMGFEQGPLSGLGFHGDRVSPVAAPQNPGQSDYFRSPSRSPQLPDLLPLRMFPPVYGTDRMSSAPAELFHSDQLAQTHSPPLFDPRTPPPPFLVHRQHSDSSARPHACSSDTDIFSQAQINKSKLDIDLGTNIESPSMNFADSSDQFVDIEDGKNLYKAALDRWESAENSVQERKCPAPIGASQETCQVDKTKPSYSDIAKTPKTSQPIIVKGDSQTPEDPLKATTPRLQKKDSKAFRPPMRRTSSGSKFLTRGSDHTKGQVASRYGLDDFSEHARVSLSSSSESLSLTNRTRRDSGSSAGSSINALDDIALTSSPDVQTKGRNTEQKAALTAAAKSFKDTTKLATKSAPNVKEHIYFDPKRIFQCKSPSKPQVQATVEAKARPVCTPAEPYVPSTLLNNGKPTAASVSAKLSSTAKQHDYINNDLRDASKLTNKTAEETAHSGGSSGSSQLDGSQKYEREPRGGRRSGARTNGGCKKEKKKSADNGQRVAEGENGPHHQQDRPSLLLENLNTGKLEELMSLLGRK
ncbi:hypothetical protein EGW08_016912 [Elysia chlorotica]|uniref:Uncharacterized protein n=1 Tax=Elysia chlorotica TaxID=188477 RepID=A0A3S0ZDS2_ELYCH|nr:hypothetical protein EGW08_016912 [Elysia chlorotica]